MTAFEDRVEREDEEDRLHGWMTSTCELRGFSCFFIRDYFLGIPVGRPYCIHCGAVTLHLLRKKGVNWLCRSLGHKHVDWAGRVHDFCLRCGKAHE